MFFLVLSASQDLNCMLTYQVATQICEEEVHYISLPQDVTQRFNYFKVSTYKDFTAQPNNFQLLNAIPGIIFESSDEMTLFQHLLSSLEKKYSCINTKEFINMHKLAQKLCAEESVHEDLNELFTVFYQDYIKKIVQKYVQNCISDKDKRKNHEEMYKKILYNQSDYSIKISDMNDKKLKKYYLDFLYNLSYESPLFKEALNTYNKNKNVDEGLILINEWNKKDPARSLYLLLIADKKGIHQIVSQEFYKRDKKSKIIKKNCPVMSEKEIISNIEKYSYILQDGLESLHDFYLCMFTNDIDRMKRFREDVTLQGGPSKNLIAHHIHLAQFLFLPDDQLSKLSIISPNYFLEADWNTLQKMGPKVNIALLCYGSISKSITLQRLQQLNGLRIFFDYRSMSEKIPNLFIEIEEKAEKILTTFSAPKKYIIYKTTASIKPDTSVSTEPLESKKYTILNKLSQYSVVFFVWLVNCIYKIIFKKNHSLKKIEEQKSIESKLKTADIACIVRIESLVWE
jgi:hypothetical protein